MITVIGLRKAEIDKPQYFELTYVDLDKKQRDKGYSQTTKYGRETAIRAILATGGVADAEINKLFDRLR